MDDRRSPQEHMCVASGEAILPACGDREDMEITNGDRVAVVGSEQRV